MRTLTLEGIFHSGIIDIQFIPKIKEPVRVLVVFLEESNSKDKNTAKFSFEKALELTKNCKGNLSDIVVKERRE